MSEEAEKKYNFIFSRLVQKPNDMVGLLAYGEYKREKIEYISSFQERHGGRSPSDAEMEVFHDLSNARIVQYRTLAEKSLAEIQSELLADQVEIIYADFESRYKQDIAKAKTSWLAAVAQSFLGSVMFTIFLGAIVFFIFGAKYGVNAVAQEVYKTFVTPQPPLTPPSP